VPGAIGGGGGGGNLDILVASLLPNLNPIGGSFRDNKSNMRGNYRKVYGKYPNFGNCLINTVWRFGQGLERQRTFL
jgi:hypothetical protein